MLLNPLEQFEIFPVLNNCGIIFTNSFFITFLFLSFYFYIIYTYKYGFLIPSPISFFFELCYKTVYDLVYANIGKQGSYFFPLIFTSFLLIIIANIVGIVPYSFTITSHLIITFTLALILYIGLNIIGIKKHKLNFLELLLPGGASLALVPLLVPIELVSYIFRVISLPVRLFANMMAGHTLLKVISGFTWSMVNLSGLMFILHFIPLLLLVLLIGLELGVALIQAYVFTILICMYINDALNLH